MHPQGPRSRFTLSALTAAILLSACSPQDFLPAAGKRAEMKDETAAQAVSQREESGARTLEMTAEAEPSPGRQAAATVSPPVPSPRRHAGQAELRMKPAMPAERAVPAVQPRAEADAVSPAARIAPMPQAHNATGGMSRLLRGGAPVAPAPLINREVYAHLEEGRLKQVASEPVSTFSVDVDTGAYANVRRFLQSGRLPPRDAVRIEEMINYFSYGYAAPRAGEAPFKVTTEIGATPWNPGTRLLQIGIQGLELAPEQLPPANLVFLIDVSGSMRSANKLGLLKSGLRMLTHQLRPVDRVAIVVYAGASGVALEPVSGDQSARIIGAVESLRAGGSTHGAAGIRLAYAKARESFIPGGINRVLLATDGDFNVGMVNFDALKSMVEHERESGVSLTTLGFGAGNLNERLMEQLADAGNGNYAYIDSAREANKVLVQQMAGTLATIAKDVKVQIEFNPAVVSEYRLIGYENRALRREDFRNDKVDAGEIGAGHNVTALYEVTLAGSGGERFAPLRYGAPEAPAGARPGTATGELAFLRMRYKQPGGSKSQLLVSPVAAPGPSYGAPSSQFRLASATAAFAQLLRGGRYVDDFGYDDVRRLLDGVALPDPMGHVGELRQLVSIAGSLSGHKNPRGDDIAVRQ